MSGEILMSREVMPEEIWPELFLAEKISIYSGLAQGVCTGLSY